MKKKYKIKFNEINFVNKWKQKYWEDYVLLGISKRWFSSCEFEWRISFFGFEIRIWFIKKYID